MFRPFTHLWLPPQHSRLCPSDDVCTLPLAPCLLRTSSSPKPTPSHFIFAVPLISLPEIAEILVMSSPPEELPLRRPRRELAVAFYRDYAHNSKNKTLEGRWGTVPLGEETPGPKRSCFYTSEEETFVDKPLDELYRFQPCWFHLRKDWPSKPCQITEKELDSSRALEIYADVCPMPDLPSCGVWGDHIANVHKFLADVCSHAWMSKAAGTAMMKIIARSIQDVVAIADEAVTVIVDKDFEPIPMNEEAYATRKHLLPPGKQEVDGYFSRFGFHKTLDDIHRDLYQRRLYAGLIDYQTEPICKRLHWGSFVWDRRNGYLIVFDAWEHKRPERLRAFLLLWRQMLYSINYPITFSFLLIPATAQRNGWECGYLALTALHHLLRGMVGLHVEDIKTKHGQVRISADTTFSMQTPPGLLEFLLRDWCFHRPGGDGACESYDDLMDKALLSLRSMAANELGIRTRQFFTPCGTETRLL